MNTATLPTLSPLVDRWHRQIGRRVRLDLPLPRPFAAFDIVNPGRQETLVPVERLTLVLLHDVVDECGAHRLRFAGYGARRIPWGVALGGAESHAFEKNLVLEPLGWARGERLDASSDWMLQTALRMDRRIERHARTRCPVGWDRPVLPAFWAAFTEDVLSEITCEGPELNGLVHETGRSVADLVAMTRRTYEDHVLLPLAWVSHAVEQATDVYANLDGPVPVTPKRNSANSPASTAPSSAWSNGANAT